MIRVLDSFIADKIAAGEVIEKPLSIIKELVENSIDAGATSVIIEIKNGGKSFIRVTDNGTGIPADELETAFLRHATGKISSIEDLDNIRTLGFRGEALASISAVSRLTVVTKTEDVTAGTRLVMHAGKKIASEAVGTNTGTTMIVEDVFYNVPARRKFMGSDAREASAIIELVQKLAIYYSSVRFMLINNGRTVISTTGDGNLRNTLESIYPEKEFKNLLEVRNDMVSGLVSPPSSMKTNRKGQIFFVNGRIVNGKTIEKAIDKAYVGRIFSGYPVAVLFITVSPDAVDVNIHPGKREVKFLDDKAVEEAIISAITDALMEKKPVAEYKFSDKAITKVSETVSENVTELKTTAPAVSEESNPAIEVEPSEEKIARTAFGLKPLEMDKEVPAPSIRDFLKERAQTEDVNLHSCDNKPAEINVTIKKAKVRPFEFEDLRYAGYILNSYIITETSDAIYMIDQHAAHERIFYERLVNQYNSENHAPQPILCPFIIEVSSDIYNSERDWLEIIGRIGYDMEDFGENTFVIRGIPSYMSLSEADDFAREFIDNIGDLRDNYQVIDKLIMKSCKSAVKANNRLSDMEIETLLKELATCENPFCCPHGRPTFIRMTRYEIERAFRRV